MSAPYQWTAVQRLVAFAVPAFMTTWLISVPTLIGASSFLTAVALFTALGWVAFTTDKNALPASRLAQALHDADHIDEFERKARSEPVSNG